MIPQTWRNILFFLFVSLLLFVEAVSQQNDSTVIQSNKTSSENVMSDQYPKSGGTLYLNLIWHQHQPLYLDPASDQLQGPWVRTHATKDYYDMASILEEYPNVHYNVNLTSSMLFQLEKYYVERLKPFVDTKKNYVDAKKFFAAWKGKTDPWIDLALKPTKDFNSADLDFLLYNTWNAFGISDVQISRFPAYAKLKERNAKKEKFTEQELREIKFWFYLAHFDPDFLEKKVWLADSTIIDLTDLVTKHADGTYHLIKEISEKECNRIIAEMYKVCSNIVPIHKKLMYNHKSHQGQIEVATTPFYHPILPLIFDSDIARICQPNDSMPNRFHYPHDADVQVAMAIEYYKKTFGQAPLGMWPGEGSVAHEVVPIFKRNGIQWIATDEKILARSKPPHQMKYYPYEVDTMDVAVVFRETELSDKIGFAYKTFEGEQAADDFIKSILRYSPKEGDPDRLLTIILDGENAWEWYQKDNDAKEFLHGLYRKLSKLFKSKQVVTVTTSEYIHGNPKRGVVSHPIEAMRKLDWLYPGSWINANYDTWIGEDEENRAWNYLLVARQDLEKSGLKQPKATDGEPKANTKNWYAHKAWEAMYAAEGSDWFWWYGTDQNAPSGDKPFDIAFITHLKNIYSFGAKAGGKFPKRDFQPIISEHEQIGTKLAGGTMAQSKKDSVTVVFKCDARNIFVRRGVYITGSHELLGNWTPNTIRMYDDKTEGDEVANDQIYTLVLQLPTGITLEYKYTNSGPHGVWEGDEIPGKNRKLIIDGTQPRIEVNDIFGKN
ncbi:MAG: carbohydrate-binding module family 20 domain-containing protein [Bacteroidota bacterium]|nr:carbohydrate-binding module family 20 domain-containing protein [Bacteroidota bacterium]